MAEIYSCCVIKYLCDFKRHLSNVTVTVMFSVPVSVLSEFNFNFNSLITDVSMDTNINSSK